LGKTHLVDLPLIIQHFHFIPGLKPQNSADLRLKISGKSYLILFNMLRENKKAVFCHECIVYNPAEGIIPMETKTTVPQIKQPKIYHFLDLIMALFVTVLITSNIASSAKIVDWGFSIFGVRMAFDAGTLLFPISYIFGDVLTEVYGFKNARRVIWTGFGALALCALTLTLVRALPGEANWLSYAGNEAFDAILGGMSSFGIVAASLAAYLLGSYSNSVIMAAMKVLSGGKLLWMRTIASTIVGEGVDTVVFVLIATLAGVFPWEAFASLTLTNYLFKVSVEALFTPATYQIVNFLKKEEDEDYFDIGTRFTPV
jgi:hypothetical protein